MKSTTYKYTSKGTQKSFRLKEVDIFVFTFYITKGILLHDKLLSFIVHLRVEIFLRIVCLRNLIVFQNMVLS